MLHSETQKKESILENTRVVEPLLCPEIKLRLITPDCPLWSANEQDLAALPIADPYWGFCWAGGQALARYILDQTEVVAGKRVFAEKATAWFRLLAECGLQMFFGDLLRGNLCDDFPVRVATYRAPADVDLHGHYLQETAIFAFYEGAPAAALRLNSVNGC